MRQTTSSLSPPRKLASLTGLVFGIEFWVNEIGLHPSVAEMYVGGLKTPGTYTVILMWHVRWSEQDFTGFCFNLFIANGEQRASGADNKYLIVGVDVPAWPLTDFVGGVKKNRDAGSDVPAFEAAFPQLGIRCPVITFEKKRLTAHRGTPCILLVRLSGARAELLRKGKLVLMRVRTQCKASRLELYGTEFE